MSCLHPSEWLHLAKKLPVGRTQRVYHGAEKRPNLVVKNLTDKYTAWCHACHKGGVYQKEFVKVLDDVRPTNRKAGDPGFLRSINLALPDLNIPYSDIVMFLHSKHMTLDYIQHLNPQWSAQDKRIVLTTEDQCVGRDTTGHSPSKWYKYYGDCSYVRAKPSALAGKTVVLTEDLFSACKGQFFYQDVLFISVMGTVVYDDLLHLLLKAKQVLVMFDGDSAGTLGTQNTLQKLRLVGIPCYNVSVPLNCDPKDQPPEWWRTLNLGTYNVNTEQIA
jgi:hypothetical protein